MLSHTPATAPVAPSVRFKENNKAYALGQTATWKSVTGLTDYRIYVSDPAAGQAEFVGILQFGPQHSFFSLRIQVKDQRIVAADTIVPGAGLSASDLSDSALGMFAGGAALGGHARPGFAQELPPDQHPTRAELAASARSYYEAINTGRPDVATFAPDCHRIENGVPTVNDPKGQFPVFSKDGRTLPNFFAMGCREQMNTGVWNTELVDHIEVPVIDAARGVAVATGLFHHQGKSRCANTRGYGVVCQKNPVPMTILLTELFKVRAGQIGEIESVWFILPHKGKAQ